MSLHSFAPEIAAQVGVNAAVIYQNFLFWCEKNKANRKHIRDGLVWTYNSRRGLSELFPYLTENQIRTAIGKLVDVGLLIKGEYNNASYDRTCWYSPSISAEWVSAIGEKSPMDWLENPNGSVKNHQPIPDGKPDHKTDGKQLSVKSLERPGGDAKGKFEEFWDRYPRKVAKKRAHVAYQKALKSHDHDEIIFGLSQHLPSLAAKEPKFIPHAATWLNDERFAEEPDGATNGQRSRAFIVAKTSEIARRAAEYAAKRSASKQSDLL